MRRFGASIVGVTLMLGLAAGCSSGSSTGSKQTSGKSSTAASKGGGSSASTVDVKNFKFSPMSLMVAVGTKVTWKFEDSTPHTVVADDKSFQSKALSGGQTYSFTFAKAGSYSYICSIHPYMKGTVVVK